MSKITKKILGASLSLAAFSFGYAQNVQAQSCVVLPTCEELGYTDIAARCENGELLKCPFDESKVFCRSVPTTTKICDTIGDVLYDDKSCAIDINNLDPNRTPIGVVFDVSRRLAIALKQSSLRWASSNNDIPGLTNYSSSSAAKGDYNGKSNTSKIIAHGDSNGYSTPAADYCYNYSTTGTNKGDWYLPAAGELQLIYNNKSTLNNSLSKVGGTQLPFVRYCSSSEHDYYSAWTFSFMYGDWWLNDKSNSDDYVRPVLAY